MVSVCKLKEEEKVCSHLNVRHSSQYKWEQKSHYCNSVALCKYLDKINYQCPVIEYAREYEAFMSGKIQTGELYEYVETGIDDKNKLKTYSLLLKREKKDSENMLPKCAPVHTNETIGEVERLLMGV